MKEYDNALADDFEIIEDWYKYREKKYKEIDAWASDPLLKEDSLNRLMDVMIEGGELDKKVPYDAVVTTEYAEDAMEK